MVYNEQDVASFEFNVSTADKVLVILILSHLSQRQLYHD